MCFKNFDAVQAIYGETHNCIDIYKQPAFNHPTLSNHKIQVTVEVLIFHGLSFLILKVYIYCQRWMNDNYAKFEFEIQFLYICHGFNNNDSICIVNTYKIYSSFYRMFFISSKAIRIQIFHIRIMNLSRTMDLEYFCLIFIHIRPRLGTYQL